jgi:hypothetical protein
MQKREHIATKRILWEFNSYLVNHIFVFFSIYILLSVAIIIRGGLLMNSKNSLKIPH